MTILRISLFLFLPFIALGNSNDFKWNHITSTINPNDITIDANNYIVSSTNGGLLLLDTNHELEIISKNMSNLDIVDIGTDEMGLVWLTGNAPNSNIQILNASYSLITLINHLDVDSILDFCFYEDRAFAIYTSLTETGILEFNYDSNDIPFFKDFYPMNELDNITIIHDVDIYENFIYVSTNAGLFSANFLNSNLKNMSSWTEVIIGEGSINNFYRDATNLYVVNDNKLLYFNDELLSWEEIFTIESEHMDFFGNQDRILFCTTNHCFQLTDSAQEIFSTNDNYKINTFLENNGILYLGLKNGGLMTYEIQNPNNTSHFIPKTLLQNDYDALTLMDNGYLAGVSKNGGFIYDGTEFSFFIPETSQEYFPIDLLNENGFSINILDYINGNKIIWSLIENEAGNLMFNNSGILPNLENMKGGLIEIDLASLDVIIYDTSRTNFMEMEDYPLGTLDGLNGISNEDTFDNYLVTRQLKKDNQNNIWVVNPYAETHNHVASVQINNNIQHWMHIFPDDEVSYLPTELTFDDNDRGWIGFENRSTWNNSDINDFSDGGIKIFIHNDYIYQTSIEDTSHVVWFEPINQEILPNGKNTTIWSLDMGKIDSDNILWVLTPQGVQGYIINGLELINISPSPYYTNMQFQQGDKIRIDSQNNAWISTRHSGVRVIQNNSTLWPDSEGFQKANSELLSDTINDVLFDNVNGQVFFATKKGISILDIPFANENNKTDNLYITPQPFIIPNQDGMYIKNLLTESHIKIMTIDGRVVNDIQLGYNQNILHWDGRDQSGNLLSTGVYIITSYKDSNVLRGKIAIIRK